MRKYIFYFFLLLSVSSCQVFQPTVGDTGGPDDVVIKIIQINDVYEIDAIDAGKKGGLARVAHISDSIKAELPNTWLFLAGDFLNPSLIGTLKINGERVQGKQMIEVLNAAGLDLVTFGNHEFDIKEEDLQKRMNESDFMWTSANVRQVQADGSLSPFYKVKGTDTIPVSDYDILKAGNASGDSIHIGVISVTIPSNPKDFVHYGNIYEEARRAHDLVAKESNFVLGLTHIALDEDKEIASILPDIPLIMGGHEHYNMKHKVGKTIITKADANAVSLYIHTLVYNTKKKKLKFKSDLVFVTDSYTSKPEVQQIVDKWNIILDENLKTLIDNPDEIIYHAVESLDGTDEASRSEQTNLGGIICRAIADAFDEDVDASITNGGSIRIDDRLAGDISAKDIFRILPFGGQVKLVEMRGKLLREILDYGIKASGTGAYLQRDNIRQGKKGVWLVQEKSIEDDKIYKIAMNDYLLLGLDIPFLTDENPGVISVYTPDEAEVANDIRKSIISYLKAGKR